MVVDLRVQAFLASHEPEFLEMKTLLMLLRRHIEDKKALVLRPFGVVGKSEPRVSFTAASVRSQNRRLKR